MAKYNKGEWWDSLTQILHRRNASQVSRACYDQHGDRYFWKVSGSWSMVTMQWMFDCLTETWIRLKTLEDEWVYIDSLSYRHENIDANKDISKGAPHMSTPKQSSSPTTSTEKQLSSTTPNKESSNAENDFVGGNTDTAEGTTSNQKQEREDEGEGENNEIIGISMYAKWSIHLLTFQNRTCTFAPIWSPCYSRTTTGFDIST